MPEQWKRIPDPTKTENWKRIPDPTKPPPITELEGVSLTAPAEPEPSFMDKVLTWPNAARFGASALGDLASATVVGPGIGGYIGEAVGRAMEGQPFDNSINMVEAGLNYIPGGGKVERAGLRGIGEQVLKSARGGAIQGAVGTAPRHFAAEGNLFSPTKWTTPGLDDFASQTVAGAGFGGAVGGGVKAAAPAIRFGGRPVATAGKILQNYTPFSDIGVRATAGFAGHSYGGPWGAVLGGAYANPPNWLKGIEQSAGRGLENIGEGMKNFGIDTNARALGEFYGKNSDPIILGNDKISVNEAPPGPIDRAPFHPSDEEALRPFRETQGPPAPPPDVTVNQAPTNPLADAPFNTPDAEALGPYQNWAQGPEYTPPPITINQAPPGPFDRVPLSETPVTPEVAPNVGTGSAFEKYMQAQARAAREAGVQLKGEDAPPVDVEGNELSFNQGEAPNVAVQAGASINPDMEIQWPRTPTPDELNQMEASGFKFDTVRNVFRRFLSDESGEFDPSELWKNTKNLFGGQSDKEGLDVAPLRQPNIFERFKEDESGTFDPMQMWDTVRRYFGSVTDDVHSPERWREVEARAREAGDITSAVIARERVQELESIGTHIPPMVDDAGNTHWEPEAPTNLSPSNPFPTTVRNLGTPQELPSPVAPRTPLEAEWEPPSTPAPPPFQMNHIWEGWDAFDRWNDLRSMARQAGNRELEREIEDQIRALDVQMNLHRNTDRADRVPLDLVDPTPFEQANAHLPPPRVRSRHGADFPESMRSYPARHAAEQAERAARQASGVDSGQARAQREAAIALAMAGPPVSTPSTSRTPPPVRRRNATQQQIMDLDIPPDKEQWFRSLHDESVNPRTSPNGPEDVPLEIEGIDRLGQISDARLSGEDDFGWTEPPPREGPSRFGFEGMYQRGLSIREPLGYTSADIDQLEVDLKKAYSNTLGAEYGRSGIEYGSIGRPGIEIKKYGDGVSAYWRDKSGKVIATARGGPNGITHLAGKKIKPDVDPATGKIKKRPKEEQTTGIGGAEGNLEVLKGLIRAGVPIRINSSLSPYSRGLVETFIKYARRQLEIEARHLNK